MAWPLIVMAVGMAISAYGTAQGNKASKKAAKQNLIELTRQAGNEKAAGHRRMYDQYKAGERATNRVYAMVGAQGGITDDVGITNIVGDITGMAAFNALSERWSSEDKARQLITQGKIGKEYAGSMAKAANIQMAGSIMQQAGSFGMSGGFGGGAAGATNMPVGGGDFRYGRN